MSRKRVVLITGSLVAHGAVAFAMFVSGAWGVERLEPEKRSISLAVMLPPPPAPSGSPSGAAQKIVPKTPKTIPKTMTQPPEVHIDKSISTLPAAPGNGLGSGKGSGDNPDGPDDTDGTCKGPDCGPVTSTTKPALEQPKIDIPKPVTPIVPPSILGALRTSGNTNLVPPDNVKMQMIREDKKRSVGTFKVCIDAQGTISSVSQMASTGYSGYDAVITTGIRTWQYRPYLVDGRATAACAAVTFVYSIK